MCVCLCLYEGVDQSEVVLETVTAPNLLYQLPSVLTDTVSFSKKELSSTPLSPLSACFLSVSLPVDCLFVFATHASIFFAGGGICTLIFYAIQWRPCSRAGFLYQILLFQVSFLSVICINHITVSVIVFKFSHHVSRKTRQLAFPRSDLSHPAIPNMAVCVSSNGIVSYLTFLSSDSLSSGYGVTVSYYFHLQQFFSVA